MLSHVSHTVETSAGHLQFPGVAFPWRVKGDGFGKCLCKIFLGPFFMANGARNPQLRYFGHLESGEKYT